MLPHYGNGEEINGNADRYFVAENSRDRLTLLGISLYSKPLPLVKFDNYSHISLPLFQPFSFIILHLKPVNS